MNLVLVLGIMIIAGFFGGMLAHRLKFPRITGYIIAGVLLSPSLLNIISGTAIDDLDVFTSIALGIIAYSIGGSLHWESIKKLEKSIFLIGPFQSIGAFILSILVITFLAPLFLDIPGATILSVYFPMAFVIGAMASATAPAAILALVREYRAKGPLTTTLLSVVALDDAIAIVLFSIALGLAQPLVGSTQGFSLSQVLLLPLLKILESVAIGAVLGLALTYIARWVKTRALLLAVVLGTILLCVGITELLDISGIMANMVVGFIVVNRLKRGEMFLVIDDIEDVIFALFFVLAGLHFDLGVMQTAGILALLIVVSRFAGKYLGTRAGATIAGAPEPVKKYLGLALMPKAGVTLGLALLAQRAFPTFGAIIFNSILA
ncbi:MAG: cation:proton antiporter, partial [Dehalococcoidales bacterium]